MLSREITELAPEFARMYQEGEQGKRRFSILPTVERRLLTESRLEELSLEGWNFDWAQLNGIQFINCFMQEVSFKGAELAGADFTGCNLGGANFKSARLAGANFTGADLTTANLINADLSGVTGLLNPSDWMEEHFKKDEHGYLVYKAIGNTYHEAPKSWTIRNGHFITEVVNPYRVESCGCGINFATVEWIVREFGSRSMANANQIWLCRLHWRDLPGLIVPYNTDGKARCSRLELLHPVARRGFQFTKDGEGPDWYEGFKWYEGGHYDE